jgi:hypothetical protein
VLFVNVVEWMSSLWTFSQNSFLTSGTATSLKKSADRPNGSIEMSSCCKTQRFLLAMRPSATSVCGL